MRIFLDTSIFVAACASEIGGSRYLFAVAHYDRTFQLVTNNYAMIEARRNVLNKLPLTAHILNDLITANKLLVMQDPPEALTLLAARRINDKDAPILAGSIFAQADILCTLDRKDFHTTEIKKWSTAFGVSILSPGDLVEQWKKNKRKKYEKN